MATASIPYTFTNGTQNADATQVNSNFSTLASFVNTELIQRDGSVAFTAIPTLPATNPTTDNQAVRKAYVDAFLPAGTIVDYGGSTAPTGWVLCDGTSYSSTNATYSRLYAAIGTTYGGSAGNFNVPDLRGRVAVGKAASGTFAALAATGGAETVTLTEAQIPSHTHVQNAHGHTGTTGTGKAFGTMNIPSTAGSNSNGNYATGWAASTAGTVADNAGTFPGAQHDHDFTTANATATNQNTGGGQAHTNLQPYIVTNKIIKL